MKDPDLSDPRATAMIGRGSGSRSEALIVGGGYAGLGAAYRLSQLGIRTTLLEASAGLGGHGACCEVAGSIVERFYHHYKPEDRHLLQLVDDLGLSDRLEWRSTRMGFLVDGKLYPFSSPIDLLRFRPFSLADKVRFGWGILRSQWTSPTPLENVSARDWAIQDWSPTIYERMLRPMLVNKFEVAPDAVSAAFLLGRIRAVAGTKSKVRGGERLAYLDGGLDVLTRRLASEVSRSCAVRLGCVVERIERTPDGFAVRANGEWFEASELICTLPLDAFERIAKNFPFRNEIAYQGVTCAVFAIREPVTPLYWINVLDEGVSFRLLVNHSALGRFPHTLLYCSNYVAPDDPVLDAPPESVLDRYLDDLRRIFGRLTVLDAVLSRSRYGTPVFDRDYRRKLEGVRNLASGLSFAGNAMVFPGARTVSSVIGTGFAAAERAASAVAGRAVSAVPVP